MCGLLLSWCYYSNALESSCLNISTDTVSLNLSLTLDEETL